MKKKCRICGKEFEPKMTFYFGGIHTISGDGEDEHSTPDYTTDVCDECYEKSKKMKN